MRSVRFARVAFGLDGGCSGFGVGVREGSEKGGERRENTPVEGWFGLTLDKNENVCYNGSVRG